MTVRVPQFDLPFRLDENGQAAVVEQDSIDDIANCVEAILRTRIGDRSSHPRFGTPDVAFTELPLPLDALVSQIRQWEPRVDLLLEQAPDRFDETLVTVGVQVTRET